MELRGMQVMQEFSIIDNSRYALEVNTTQLDLLPYYRWEHRATIGYNTREFLVIVDVLKGTGYIEEIIGGHLEQIKDDSFYNSIYNFAMEHEFFVLSQPILKPTSKRYI
jgi:hypothetical protein